MPPRSEPFADLFDHGPRHPIQVRGADVTLFEASVVEIEVSAYGDQYAPPRILGLPDATIRESYYRVATAFRSLDWSFPRGQVVINLAPAA
ncbi:MAG TPA: magnesium chelatase domain-containing protein, partial [Planctomycetota bacterium]|nr:magnesium chelatase domain-containing protein [Planctomycetota bacterium]